MKKLMALLLAVLMVVSMFTACSDPKQPADDQTDVTTPVEGEGETEVTVGKQADGSYVYEDGVVMSAPGEFPIVKEGEVTLSIGMHQEANVTSYAYGENEFTTYLQDRSGIKIEFDRMGSTAAETLTQLQLRLATGEKLPDIVMDCGPARLDCWDYMADGVMLPLQDYIEDYGYYYDKALETMAVANPELLAAVGSYNDPDGNMPMLWKYSLSLSSMYDKQAYINKQWLDNLGLEVPTTTDELYEVLVAFRDQDPNGNGLQDEIPMLGASETSASYVPNICDFILTAFVYFSPRQHLIDEGDGRITFVGITEGFREGMKYIRKLVDEGLIPDFNFTQTTAQQKAVVDPADPEAPSVVGVVVESPSFVFNLDNSERILEYVAVPCLTGPEGIQYSSVYDTAMKFNCWISGDCEYPEIAFRFFDMFYDIETYYHMQYGTYGERWWWAGEWAEQNGVDLEDLEDRYADVVAGRRIDAIKNMDGLNVYADEHAATWAIIPLYYYPSTLSVAEEGEVLNGLDPSDPNDYADMIHDEGLATRIGKIPETHVPGTLLNGLTPEETEEAKEIRSNLNTHFYNTRTAFQTGEMDIYDDAVWEQYLKDLEAYGLSECLEIYQACYDRYLASNK